MKRFVAALLLGFGALAAASYVDARPYGGHGHGGYYGRSGYGHGGARVGVYFGAGVLASPWLYPRPYYGPYGYYPGPYGYYSPAYYPTVVVEQPVVYTEQAQTAPPPVAAPQAQQQYWFFCQDTQTYYPHVQNCATPWQRVIPYATR